MFVTLSLNSSARRLVHILTAYHPHRPYQMKLLLRVRCNFIKELYFVYFYNNYLCVNIYLSLLIRHHEGRFIHYPEKTHNTNNITNARRTNITNVRNCLANAYNLAPDYKRE